MSKKKKLGLLAGSTAVTTATTAHAMKKEADKTTYTAELMSAIKPRKMGFYEKYIKRGMDVICASAAILCFSPIYAGVALLVKIKLGSPVIFTQDRPGLVDKDGRETIFKMYKFRTMTDERDEEGNLLPDEVRLTKFGAWLRKTSLDELPEAFNILNGTMSVIGPRPQLVRDGIKMFLVGGSLLGAVRHGGFIPWDDDIDFGMKRCDYQKFIEIFDSELGDRYYLRCPNSKYPNGNRFMQIYKRGTTLKVAEGSTPLQPNCVLIDVFPYDYVPDNKLLRILKGIYCNFLMLIAASVTGYVYPNENYKKMMMHSFTGKCIFYGEYLLGKLFSWKKPEEWFNKVDRAVQQKKKSKYVTSAMGRKHYLGEIFSEKVFFPLSEIKFEELKLYAPADPQTYLLHNYGKNYMTPPSRDNQESHFVLYFDLNKEENI